MVGPHVVYEILMGQWQLALSDGYGHIEMWNKCMAQLDWELVDHLT